MCVKKTVEEYYVLKVMSEKPVCFPSGTNKKWKDT